MSPTVETRPSARLRGVGFLLVTAFGWGVNWPMIRLVLSQLPPFTARAASSGLGMLVAFAAAALLRGRLRPPAGQYLPLLISATLNFAAFSALSTLSVQLLNASEAAILVFTLPLWSALLAWPILGERLTGRKLAALAIGLSGVVVLMANRLHFGGESRTLMGIGCGLTASMLFALGTVLAKRRPLAMPPMAAVAWQLGIAAVLLAVLAGFEQAPWSQLSTEVWLGLLYMSTVSSTLAYFTWFRALRLLPASTAAIGSLLVPVIGVGAAALTLGEPLGARQLIALALTVSGVALAVRG
jgi:drug/metabolite transporter (DMT)-like permease